MILVDTSIWVEHFKRRNELLTGLIANGNVLGHPFVTGELAVGDLRPWDETVSSVRGLPQALVASEEAFLTLLADEGLVASGLGFVDVHLLASCRMDKGLRLWTADRRLERHAARLDVGWQT